MAEVELIDDRQIPAQRKHTVSVPSRAESIHFEDDVLGAVGDIESDDSGSGSSTSTPPPDGDSVVDLDALDDDVVDMFSGIESDDSASTDGQEMAMQEVLERQRAENAKRPKMAKKKTVIDLLLGREDDVGDIQDEDSAIGDDERESSTSDESYSFLVH